MGKQGKRYSDALKKEAVQLVFKKGMSAKQVSEQLDIGYQTLCHLVKKAKDTKEIPGDEAAQALIRSLQEELRIARMERDIRKKATAFFAKESK